MKNHYKVIALAALMFSSSAAIGASSGTINFTGEVKPTTCDVLINGVASPVTIALPAVDQNLLDAAGKTTAWTDIKIALSKCQGTSTTSSAAAYFEGGSTVDDTTFRLKNTLTNEAENVQLELRDSKTEKMIEIGQSSQTTGTTKIAFTNSATAVELPYRVGYYATGVATPGLVASSVDFTINYE